MEANAPSSEDALTEAEVAATAKAKFKASVREAARRAAEETEKKETKAKAKADRAEAKEKEKAAKEAKEEAKRVEKEAKRLAAEQLKAEEAGLTLELQEEDAGDAAVRRHKGHAEAACVAWGGVGRNCTTPGTDWRGSAPPPDSQARGKLPDLLAMIDTALMEAAEQDPALAAHHEAQIILADYGPPPAKPTFCPRPRPASLTPDRRRRAGRDASGACVRALAHKGAGMAGLVGGRHEQERRGAEPGLQLQPHVRGQQLRGNGN